MQRTENRTILIENKIEESPLCDFKAYFKATVIKTCVASRQINRTELQVQKQTHTYMAHEFLTKVPRQFNGERITFHKRCWNNWIYLQGKNEPQP